MEMDAATQALPVVVLRETVIVLIIVIHLGCRQLQRDATWEHDSARSAGDTGKLGQGRRRQTEGAWLVRRVERGAGHGYDDYLRIRQSRDYRLNLFIHFHCASFFFSLPFTIFQLAPPAHAHARRKAQIHAPCLFPSLALSQSPLFHPVAYPLVTS